MTARATFTVAEIARAIRAADSLGKVALITRAGIALVSPDAIAHPAQADSEGDTCAGKFGRRP